MFEICANVSTDLTGEYCLVMENAVERLHVPPCPKEQLSGQEMTAIIDIFWREFKMTGCYAILHGQFCTPDVLEGRSHIWHETYSLQYTKVLGFVACRVTSKRLGIGSGEHAWSDVKQIKDGKRSNLSGDSLENRAILFTLAHLEEARLFCTDKGSNGDMFGDDDIR